MKSIRTTIVILLGLMASVAGYGEEPRASAGRDPGSRTNGHWRVQVGWVHQWGRGMTVRSSAAASSFGGLSLRSGALGSTTPGIYDDGYVLPDLWTGDTGVPADRQGMTWNWGANNPSQYDYDNGVHPTLTFHRDRGETVGSAYSVSEDKSEDDLPSNGIEIKTSLLLYSWTSGDGPTNNPNGKAALDMNLIVGLALFPGSTQKYRRTSGQDVFNTTETYTYLDYYGTVEGGSWPALELPYSGSYGAVSDPAAGPLIPATPESVGLESTYMGSYRDTVAIKSKIWRLRGEAGLEFVKPLTERLDVYVAPQIVIEFIDMNADRTETVTYNSEKVSSRTDSEHKMTIVPGVLLTAGADYRLSESWYAGVSVGYEWLAEDPSIRVGSDKVNYDLNGGEFSLYVGCRF